MLSKIYQPVKKSIFLFITVKRNKVPLANMSGVVPVFFLSSTAGCHTYVLFQKHIITSIPLTKTSKCRLPETWFLPMVSLFGESFDENRNRFLIQRALQANKEKEQHLHQQNMDFRIDVRFQIIPYVLENVHLHAKCL